MEGVLEGNQEYQMDRSRVFNYEQQQQQLADDDEYGEELGLIDAAMGQQQHESQIHDSND